MDIYLKFSELIPGTELPNKIHGLEFCINTIRIHHVDKIIQLEKILSEDFSEFKEGLIVESLYTINTGCIIQCMVVINKNVLILVKNIYEFTPSYSSFILDKNNRIDIIFACMQLSYWMPGKRINIILNSSVISILNILRYQFSRLKIDYYVIELENFNLKFSFISESNGIYMEILQLNTSKNYAIYDHIENDEHQNLLYIGDKEYKIINKMMLFGISLKDMLWRLRFE